MTLVQLRHLIALAELGSFSKAAPALFLTQPALSRSIRALEDELGLPLFDRVGRRIELTPLGRATLERARRLVADTDELLAGGQGLAGGRAGTLRVGMGSGPGAMLMTPLLLQVARERPGLTVEVARGSTERLVQALRERTLDALVVDVRSLPPAADLQVDAVHEMRGAFMVRAGHPLARHQGVLRFADLSGYPLASTPLSDEVARVLIQRYGPRADPAQAVTLRCEELASLVEVGRASDAVLFAIRAAAPDMVELTLTPALDATARFGLVTLARRSAAAALPVLQALMRERLRDAHGIAAPSAPARRRAGRATRT